MQAENSLIVDGATLSCSAVAAVARRGAAVAVAPDGLARAVASHEATTPITRSTSTSPPPSRSSRSWRTSGTALARLPAA
jgi:hypothetical protein